MCVAKPAVVLLLCLLLLAGAEGRGRSRSKSKTKSKNYKYQYSQVCMESQVCIQRNGEMNCYVLCKGNSTCGSGETCFQLANGTEEDTECWPSCQLLYNTTSDSGSGSLAGLDSGLQLLMQQMVTVVAPQEDEEEEGEGDGEESGSRRSGTALDCSTVLCLLQQNGYFSEERDCKEAVRQLGLKRRSCEKLCSELDQLNAQDSC